MKYLLVGEMHGTSQCPKAFFEIVKKNNIRQVALEFSKDKQKEVDQYYSGLKSINDLTIFKNKEKSHDGRASRSIKKLFPNLKRNKIKIYFVDSEPSDPLRRDYLMAKNLGKIKGRIAFLCGNIHASKKAIKLPSFFIIVNKIRNLFGKGMKVSKKGIIKTCGSFLPEKETISYKIVAINGGKYYNFGVHNIKSDKRFGNIKLNNLPKIVNSQEEGFDHFYLINKFTPSS